MVEYRRPESSMLDDDDESPMLLGERVLIKTSIMAATAVNERSRLLNILLLLRFTSLPLSLLRLNRRVNEAFARCILLRASVGRLPLLLGMHMIRILFGSSFDERTIISCDVRSLLLGYECLE